MTNIDPKQFADLLVQDTSKELIIVDVREQQEWDYYHLEDSLLMPMNTVPERLDEISMDQDVYIICAHGVRSERVCSYLRDRGFEKVINVDGGMAAIAYLRGFAYD
ncbi:rhodanese-like domain-containing protein [Paenibacillus eucommiae]|uniref:Rhodanese-related sulfurtransferase n=1 Tax=Paenibacillus eucommiae TaxID=1355755 RepID=A0ABS4IMY7_9BACL|nr:rhodanese-like domain-containing protein [Paenibacillus eucommiae]MBP1988927.1 rhodanese-related sulfurtransferase [Paenibacillus eucommiae]